MSTNNSFPALRTCAQIFRILAYVAGAIGVIMALVTLFTAQGFLGRIGGFLLTLLFTAFYALMLVATSEGIHVGLAIEDNTRKTAETVGKGGAHHP